MIKAVLFCLVLVFNLAEAFAQDIKGLWNGYITTDDHDAKASYIISVEEQKDGIISGKALLYKPNIFAEAFGLQQFFGTINKDRITISDVIILDERIPASRYFLCFKLSSLTFNKNDTLESLTGNWRSNASTCLPGRIFLTRYNSAVKVTDKVPEYVLTAIRGSGDRPMFKNTELSTIVLDVKSSNLELELRDYMKTDNDTVSIYLNRRLIINRLNISKNPYKFNIRLSRNLASNELILYANNIGLIPPNTSLLIISDGEKKHRLLIESTLQKSVAIYLKRSSP
jgi:hypothetical protein